MKFVIHTGGGELIGPFDTPQEAVAEVTANPEWYGEDWDVQELYSPPHAVI